MSDLNNVTLMGRLVRDAEKKQSASGKTCAFFSIAVNRTRKENDQFVSVPTFLNLGLFGNRADGLLPYLTKGQQVVIEGHLEQRQWDSNGERRTNLEVVVDNLHLAGFRKNDSLPEPVIDDTSENTEYIETEFFS